MPLECALLLGVNRLSASRMLPQSAKSRENRMGETGVGIPVRATGLPNLFSSMRVQIIHNDDVFRRHDLVPESVQCRVQRQEHPPSQKAMSASPMPWSESAERPGNIGSSVAWNDTIHSLPGWRDRAYRRVKAMLETHSSIKISLLASRIWACWRPCCTICFLLFTKPRNVFF